jgi:murein hydrolase activator
MIQFKYKRKSNLLLLAALLFAFVFVNPLPAQNGKSSKRDLENKKKRINQEIKQINQMLSETNANKKSSMGALVSLNIKLQKRQELINTINAQLNELDRDISKNQGQVVRLKSNLEKLKKEYARMIVFAQRNQDAYTTLMFIFAAQDFNQAYSRMKYMQQYTEFRRKQAQEIINTQALLNGKIKELNAQKAEKSDLLSHEQAEKRTLSSERQAKEQVLTELQKKEKQLKNELEKKKEDAVKLQLAIKRLIEAEIKRKAEENARKQREKLIAAKKEREKKEKLAAAKKKKNQQKTIPDKDPEISTSSKKENMVPELSDEAIALSADFANNRGKLPWPVTKGVICETYGEHEHPAIKGFMMFNNGVEICATKGMQARAVFEGEVTGIAVSPAGGNLVIIRHGEYLSVYSNIDDVLVKTGQKVNVKQAIGTVLHNEDEDRSSINLQIWKGQKTLDPSGWLFNAR